MASDSQCAAVMIERPAVAHFLGFHRLGVFFAGLQLSLLFVTSAALSWTGMRLEWKELASPSTFAVLLMWSAWLLLVRTPGRHPREWVIAETFLVVALLVTFSNIGSPLQYAIIAFRAPLADPWLAK